MTAGACEKAGCCAEKAAADADSLCKAPPGKEEFGPEKIVPASPGALSRVDGGSERSRTMKGTVTSSKLRAVLRNSAAAVSPMPVSTGWSMFGCCKENETPESVLERLHWHAEFTQQLHALERKKLDSALDWEKERARIVDHFSREVENVDQMIHMLDELQQVGEAIAGQIDHTARTRASTNHRRTALVQDLLGDIKAVGVNTEPMPELEDVAALRRRAEEAEAEAARLRTDLAECHIYVKAVEARAAGADRDKGRLKVSLARVTAELRTAQERFKEAEGDLNAQNNRSLKMLDLACVQHVDLQNRYLALKAAHEEAEARARRGEEEARRLAESLDTASADLMSVSKALAHLLDDRAGLRELLLATYFPAGRAPSARVALEVKKGEGAGRGSAEPVLVFAEHLEEGSTPVIEVAESMLAALRLENLALKQQLHAAQAAAAADAAGAPVPAPCGQCARLQAEREEREEETRRRVQALREAHGEALQQLTAAERELQQLGDALDVSAADLAVMQRALARVLEDRGELQALLLASYFADRAASGQPLGVLPRVALRVEGDGGPQGTTPVLVFQEDLAPGARPRLAETEALLAALRLENLALRERAGLPPPAVESAPSGTGAPLPVYGPAPEGVQGPASQPVYGPSLPPEAVHGPAVSPRMRYPTRVPALPPLQPPPPPAAKAEGPRPLLEPAGHRKTPLGPTPMETDEAAAPRTTPRKRAGEWTPGPLLSALMKH